MAFQQQNKQDLGRKKQMRPASTWKWCSIVVPTKYGKYITIVFNPAANKHIKQLYGSKLPKWQSKNSKDGCEEN